MSKINETEQSKVFVKNQSEIELSGIQERIAESRSYFSRIDLRGRIQTT